MNSDDLNIPGDYSDHHILKEEYETISNNDEKLVKSRRVIWRRIVMLICYSHRKRTVKN